MLGSANPRPGEAGFCVVEQRAHAGTPHQQKSGRHLLVNLCGKLSSCAFVPGTQREAVVSGGVSCEEYTAGGHVLARVIALLHVLARFWHRAGTEGTTQGQGLGGQPRASPQPETCQHVWAECRQAAKRKRTITPDTFRSSCWPVTWINYLQNLVRERGEPVRR